MKPSTKKNKDRQRAEKSGRLGEFYAELWMRLQFLQLIARRYKSPVGEIDLVMKRGKLLVFVEVKARTNRNQLDAALETVNQSRIIAATHHFLAHHKNMTSCDIRFDVILVAPWRLPTHMPDAFRP